MDRIEGIDRMDKKKNVKMDIIDRENRENRIM